MFVAVSCLTAAMGQVKTDFLDQHMNLVAEADEAVYTRTTVLQPDGLWHVEIKFANNVIKMRGSYSDLSLQTEEGLFQFFYANGIQESEGYFKQGIKVGVWKRWDWDGNSKTDRIYSDDIPKSLVTKIVPAEFPGGDESLTVYLLENLNYPEEARKTGASGTVYIAFVIGIAGDISNVQVVEGRNYYLDMEAKRLVSSMPNWKPATKNGSKVESTFILPVSFDAGALAKKEE